MRVSDMQILISQPIYRCRCGHPATHGTVCLAVK